MRLRIWDLLSGAGGASCGYQMASKGHHYTALDKWQTALDTYARNIENSEVLDPQDILDFDPSVMGHVDILHCSPVCTTFSGININGDRCFDTSIIEKCLEIIALVKPKFWILEESPFAADFVPNPRFLCANDFGLYHRRRRLVAGNYPDVRPTRHVRVIHRTVVAQEVKAFTSGMRLSKEARSCCQWFGRRLTTWELQVLMGFPPDYFFHGDYKERCMQIGNAVCPPVAKAIMETMLGHWNEKSLLDYALAM